MMFEDNSTKLGFKSYRKYEWSRRKDGTSGNKKHNTIKKVMRKASTQNTSGRQVSRMVEKATGQSEKDKKERGGRRLLKSWNVEVLDVTDYLYNQLYSRY